MLAQAAWDPRVTMTDADALHDVLATVLAVMGPDAAAAVRLLCSCPTDLAGLTCDASWRPSWCN
jgi:hypothetical protein